MLDGTEDDILWENDAVSPDSSNFSNDKNKLAYANGQLCEVFNESFDDEEFLGFEWNLCRLQSVLFGTTHFQERIYE